MAATRATAVAWAKGSRTAHAANGLSPIFDKEKEQRRLQEAQLIGEIGTQVGTIARTEGKIASHEEARKKMAGATDEDRAKAKADWERANGGRTATEKDINGQLYQNFYEAAFRASESGTGGKVQRAIQAATAAAQGLAGGDLKAALAGGAAPYIATVIARSTDDLTVRTMAHAAVNAALAKARGDSALGSAAGAATAEMMAPAIIAEMGWNKETLTEEQRQAVSALSTLAAGLAGGLAGDSTGAAASGAQAGKVTVENNHLSQEQQQNRSEELTACGGDASCKANVREKYAKEFDNVQEQINNCSSAEQCVALAKELKQWKADNTARLDELSSKARNNGVDSLTPAEVQEWANLRGAQSNFDGSINTLIYRAQTLGGSEETTTELTNIFGHAAIANAAGAAGGISKAGKGSSLPTSTKTTAENGLDYQSNPKHTPGQQGYSPKAGTEPKNSINLFGNSIEYGKKRYAIDADGNVHQFTNTNDGTWHWSGSTGDKTVPIKKSNIPNDVKKEFGLPGKWR